MGDRCFLEMTIHKEDLPKFAASVWSDAKGEWWDDLYETDFPGLVNVSVNEANYGWLEERQQAAKAGIAFMGTHGEGGCYGSFAFAAVDGEMDEAPLSHDGDLIIAVDENLEPVDGGDETIRVYVKRLRAVERFFGLWEEETDANDQPQRDPQVPAGLRGP